MATIPSTPVIVEQKLAAFDRLQPEFEACFQFVEDVHGQKRFSAFAVADAVRYLHSLWICECKTHLLSVSKSAKVYDGRLCLELLDRWQQQGDTASVVEFLNRKLDMLPLADITRQIQEARHLRMNDGTMFQRLLHGRGIMLHRGFNLMHLLDALFVPSLDEISEALHLACQQYGHLPEQIAQQLDEMDSPLFSYVPHQLLAQRNMQVMNKLSLELSANAADRPGRRSSRVNVASEPWPPYAEQVLKGYQPLTSPGHNNLNQHKFVDRPERSARGTI